MDPSNSFSPLNNSCSHKKSKKNKQVKIYGNCKYEYSSYNTLWKYSWKWMTYMGKLFLNDKKINIYKYIRVYMYEYIWIYLNECSCLISVTFSEIKKATKQALLVFFKVSFSIDKKKYLKWNQRECPMKWKIKCLIQRAIS